jgi:bacillithiol synthase
MVHTIAIRDIPGTTKIYTDCWDAAQSFRNLVPRHFQAPGAFREQAKLVGARRYDRAGLCATLAEQNERFGAGPRTAEAIRRLSEPESLVVIGGQQAGLFGGPLYTLHKAFTALLVARRMERELGRPVLPVFWIAAEDSDLAEVNHAFVTDREGALRELRLPGATQAKLPVSSIRLGEAVGALIEELAGLLPESGTSAELIADLRAAYTPGRTYPQAFGSWMAGLFRDLGLILVDPSDVRLKRQAQGLFEREIREKSPVSAAVREQTARMLRAGYHPQIELRDGLLTLFHQDPAREAITVTENGFELKSSGKRHSADALAGLLQRSPELFTPNAVLRPLFQDTLFPTLAVVLGPSEIAYFSQLTLAYERIGIPMPILFPRASLTLIEPKQETLMERLGIGLGDLMARGERVIDDVVRKAIPPSLSERLSRGRVQAQEAWAGFVDEIDRLDGTLHRTAELASGRTLRQFDFMERKLVQAQRRKDVVLRGQVSRLASALAPRDGLQERTLTALPLLARHGKGIVGWIADSMDPFAPAHQGLLVDR